MRAPPARNGLGPLNTIAASVWLSAVGLAAIHAAASYVQHFWG